MQRFMRMKYLEALSHFCVVVGIAFATLQYISSQKDGRVSATLLYLDSFYQPRLTEARANLLDFSATKLAPLSGLSGNQKAIASIADSFIFSDDRSARRDLTLILEHLDFLATCVEANTCDGELANRQLCDFANSILENFSQPLERLRNDYGMRNLGIATAAVFTKPCVSPENRK